MDDSTSLGAARAWLRARVDEGERCPCCRQFAKIYRRKVYSTIARALILMWRKAGTGWIDINAVTGQRGGDTAKLAYWGLIEPHADQELWRLTALGERYVRRIELIPKYAVIYDGRCLRLEGEMVDIMNALGTRFNYDDLMRGV